MNVDPCELEMIEDRDDDGGLVMEWRDGGGCRASLVIWRLHGQVVLVVPAAQC